MEHEAEVVGVGTGSAPGGDVPAVILSARGEYLPIFVSTDQAQSIGIRIDDLRDGTFYAKVDAERYENGEPEEFVFDARPSDALALAVRIDCPIIVSDEVLDEAGRSPDSVQFDDGPHEGS